MREGDDTYRPCQHLDEVAKIPLPSAEGKCCGGSPQAQPVEEPSASRREGDDTYRPANDVSEEQKNRAVNKVLDKSGKDSECTDSQVEEDANQGSWVFKSLIVTFVFVISLLTVKFAFLLQEAQYMHLVLRVLAYTGIVMCGLIIGYAVYSLARVCRRIPYIEQVSAKDDAGNAVRSRDQAKALHKYFRDKETKYAFPDGMSFDDYEKQIVRKEGCARKLRSLSNDIDDYEDWMADFCVFEKMQDEAASKCMLKRAGLVFIKTGASPWKIVDIMAVLYHSVNMATEIARIYRRRVTRAQAIRLVFDGLFAIGVASVAQDAFDTMAETLNTKVFDAGSKVVNGLLGKVAAKTAEGALNAALVYRLGCRLQRRFKPRVEQVCDASFMKKKKKWNLSLLLVFVFVVGCSVAICAPYNQTIVPNGAMLSTAEVHRVKFSAEGGDADAQCQTGLFYMNGLGVDQDEDKAVEWLNKAAAQNHAQAQYNLGIYYARFSDKEAQRLSVKWLKEAAKQDYADAEYNLAKLYLNPHHPASKEQGAGRQAIQLLRLAAAQGHSGAKKELEKLGMECQ